MTNVIYPKQFAKPRRCTDSKRAEQMTAYDLAAILFVIMPATKDPQ